ncbi:hypothetical protein PsAD13_01444 [Pseudovibrio sp. Ad13]|uniref:ATP-grasp domain-containing protein n=1 Tax=Pseudovibrio sp. Ad13 TaxID=989396 RepID=UPI0007AE5546|nr:ATP-grasp domain-containing protein [Pseudovibrio sp. Ad13]KZK84910.1 hypothetical protein PsAD13_01444 [Pseudovibrio sp. Ad13]
MKKIVIFFRGEVAMHFKYLDNFVRVIKDLKYSLHVMFHSGSTPPKSMFNKLLTYEFIDLSSVPDVRARVDEICSKEAIERIFVFHDEDVYTACLCREDNNIVGLRPAAGIHFRDKNVMQQRAKELGLKTPHCCVPHTRATLDEFAGQHGYPIIIKPYDGYGCGNTFKVETPEQLEEIWKKIRNERHDYRVEAYIHGVQYFIDSLVQNGETVFDNLSQYTYNIIDYKESGQHQGVITLGQGENTEQRDILAQCRHLLNHFGMHTGVAHTEFYLTDDGEIYFGESAARCGGGPIISLINHAYGFDLVEQWVRLDLNEEAHITQDYTTSFGAEYLSTLVTGSITQISDSDAIRALPSVLEAEVWAQKGDVLKEAEHCYEVLGYYICHGDDFAGVAQKFRNIREAFQIQVGN